MVASVAVFSASASAAPVQDGDRHQVGRGETLSRVAKRYGVSVDALVSANGLVDPNVVYPGTWLRIPATGTGAARSADAPATHTVVAGQNLISIAGTYGVSVDALARANGITNPNVVVVGRRLTVPTTGRSAPAAEPVTSKNWPARLRSDPGRQAWIPVFDTWAAAYGVPADLAKAVAWLESGWQNGVVSSTGAVGIGQLMPDTVVFIRLLIGAAGLDPADPFDNIRMSVRYLAWLLRQTGGDAAWALGGDYQGLRSIESRGLYGETLAYIRGVQQLRSRF
jgi:LysM repeat protein